MNILVVDDDEVTRNLLSEILQKENFSVKLAASGESALKILAQVRFSIILSDIRMLDVDGLALLSFVKKHSIPSIVILMTGFGNLEGAVKAIQEGAFDYISKPFKVQDLKQLVHRAAKQWKSIYQDPAHELLPSLQKEQLQAKALLGKSPQIVEVYKNLARASVSSSNILIVGESGTGKELVARAIHENSSRRNKKFIAVNCSTFSMTQLESDLFDVNGVILKEASDYGASIFLDEIDELSLAMQVKLLRVMRDDIRIIASTRKNLDVLVREGKFREDLFYRLKVIEILLPPLRNRSEDLPDLVNHFLAHFSEKNNKKISHISDEAMQVLYMYSWPGNVRELEHAIERAVTMAGGSVLFPEDFPVDITKSATIVAHDPLLAASGDAGEKSLEDMEKLHILKVLKEAQFNKSKAAEVLGIDRATLYRKAQKYGIDLKSEK